MRTARVGLALLIVGALGCGGAPPARPTPTSSAVVERVILEIAANRGELGNVEQRGNVRALGTDTDQPLIGPLAEREAECFDEDRFAAARFARQHRQAGFEIDLDIAHHDQVPDRECTQHGSRPQFSFTRSVTK